MPLPKPDAAAWFQTTPKDTSKKDSTNRKYVPSKRPTFKPTDRQGDPFSNPGNGTPVLGEQPSNIKTEVTLDSATGNYTIHEKAGGVDVRPPTTMTFEEYTRYKQRENMKNYMKAKSEGAGGQGPMSNNRLIPKIYFSPAFDRIFGGNAVDLKPNGTVVLDFGINSQRVFNPALPIRQQQNTQFLFDQQISVNVLGKVGEKVKLTINYDTKANFDFDNNVKIDYTGFDNEILQKIELGNVSLPISSQLITGAQNLFGAKATMKFGRLKVVAVASTQRSKMDKINVKGTGSGGGAQSREISIRIDDYDANRHFFLGQFFRNNYEKALNNPAINPPASGITINAVDVYVTNKQLNTQTQRNIVAFADLGEGEPHNKRWYKGGGARTIASNNANTLYATLSNDPAIQTDNARDDLIAKGLVPGTDFEILRGARKLTERDFSFHPQLGYITLNTPLVSQDDILAVAYQFSYNGQIYTVGQPANVAQNTSIDGRVILKMLRSTTNNVALPMWDLQMKNIYSLQTTAVQKEGFQMRVIYRDDSTGVDNPALRQGRRVKDVQLTQLLNADRLSAANELQPDGQFDWIPGVTIDTRNGLLIFPVVEPFGTFLDNKFDNDEQLYKDHYVFKEMYRTTKALAKQYANKAKFFLTGRVQSTSSGDISLNSPNVASGSVSVYAGLNKLTEGTDYTVDPVLGKVKIINPAYAGQDLEIRYEKADLFNFQQRSFFGTRLDYTVSKDINIGGSFLYLNERPLIRRVAVGEEPSSNFLYGFDVNYKKDSRLITKLVDKLPFISTKETSSVNFQGEYAQLIPSTSTFVDATGKGISYIDDFEGIKNSFDFTSNAVNNWKFASVPIGFDKSIGDTGKLATNFRRAKLAWYNIDNTFYATSGSIKPKNITTADIQADYVRPVLPQEVFPNRQPGAVVNNQVTLDLAYYPSERGMYNYSTNYDANGLLKNPTRNWGGITHAFTSNGDFDAANVEYLEFWMMSPFKSEDVGGNTDGGKRTGQLYINLGNISEDALKDSRQEFENGLPTDGSPSSVATTVWGKAPTQTPITQAFDLSGNSRAQQDVGLDGINNADESVKFASYVNSLPNTIPAAVRDAIAADPSGDDFRYFLDGYYDANNAKILERYKNYNHQEGNSPVNSGGNFTPSSSTYPDNEDINNDNTLSENNSYYKYRIDIDSTKFKVGSNYIVDKQRGTGKDVDWYLFRIPIRDLGHPNFAGKEGDISDFRSIRFMRMFLTGFSEPVVLRMVQLQTVASTWRPYEKALPPEGPYHNDENDGTITIGTVNIEENGSTGPSKVPYVVPPGLPRDVDVTSGVNRALNEQSLSVCVERLRANSAKAVFKTIKADFLNYARLRMWVSANTHDRNTKDNEVMAFMRLGTDFTDNYYEIEVPLVLSKLGTTSADEVWKLENEINIEFAALYALKVARNVARVPQNAVFSKASQGENGRQNIYVKGNPDLNNANIAMLGVRVAPGAYGRPKSLCVWFDELRVTDFVKNSGWATTGRLAIKMADLGTFTATGKYVSVGFGGIEQKISERARNWTYSYNLTANITLDKFLPKKAGIKLPMYLSYEQQFVDPKYDPLNPDIELKSTLANMDDDVATYYNKIVQDKQTRKSINFTNVQKVKTKEGAKSYPWDIENISLTYAYSETKRTNVNLESYLLRTWKYAGGYQWSNNKGSVEPFKNAKFLSSPWLKLVKDFNFNVLPSSISARIDLDRSWTRTQLRSSDVFATTNTILPTFEKSFFMTRVYGLRYSPVKSLTLDYSATVSAIIDEPYGDVSGNKAKEDTIFNNIKKLGRMKNFNQTMRASYKVPLDKLPLTDWLNADVSYSAGYIWTAAPLAFQDTLGNVIQNSRDRQLNGKIDLVRLYNKVSWLNKVNNPPPPDPNADKNKKAKDKNAKSPTGVRGVKAAPDTAKKKRDWAALKGIARILMSVRSINLSYGITENTTLPGWRPNASFFGNNFDYGAPGWDFIAGDQNPNIRFKANEYHWLARSTLQNQPFTQSLTENMTGRVSIEPIRDLRIQLDAKITNTGTFQENYRNTDTLGNDYLFQSLNPARGGSYTISYVAIQTAFDQMDSENKTSAFRRFESDRDTIIKRLEDPKQNPNISLHRDVKYGLRHQDVLIPSLLAAYTNTDPNQIALSSFPKIPLPNWRLDYAGLTRIKWLGDKFSSINLTHGYTCTYTVSQYRSSLQYSQNLSLSHRPTDSNLPSLLGQAVDSAGNTIAGNAVWLPVYNISQVTLVERFQPLIGINIRTKSKITLKFDMNKERNIALNIANSNMIELNSYDFTFGVGYQKSGLRLPFRVQGRTITLKNELTTRCDVTLRDTRTIQRNFSYYDNTGALNQPPGVVTQGTQDLQIKPTVNYMVNKQLNVQGYLEYTLNTPKVSTSFQRSATRFGIQLRFTLM